MTIRNIKEKNHIIISIDTERNLIREFFEKMYILNEKPT